MDHLAPIRLHHHLQRLIKAPMNKRPDMPHVAPKGIRMLPLPLAAVARLCAALQVQIDALPMLHLAIDGDAELEGAGRRLARRVPVGLHHDGRRGADAGAEDLAGLPAG